MWLFVCITREQPAVSWQNNYNSGRETISIPHSFVIGFTICEKMLSGKVTEATAIWESLHYMEQGVIYGALILCSGAIWQTYWLWHSWGRRYRCTFFPLWHHLIKVGHEHCHKLPFWCLTKMDYCAFLEGYFLFLFRNMQQKCSPGNAKAVAVGELLSIVSCLVWQDGLSTRRHQDSVFYSLQSASVYWPLQQFTLQQIELSTIRKEIEATPRSQISTDT